MALYRRPGPRHRSRPAPSRSGVPGGTVPRGRWCRRYAFRRIRSTRSLVGTKRRGCWIMNRSDRVGSLACLAAVVALAFGFAHDASAETWRGLTVAPESRCSPYDKKRHYPIRSWSRATSSATSARCTGPTRSRASHRLVRPISNTLWRPTSEAHDSGLCAEDAETRARFARDLRNLTLAAPHVNRHQKSAKDAAEWVPARNRCWFAGRVLEVHRAYALSADRREAPPLESLLSSCESRALEPWRASRRWPRGLAPLPALWPLTVSSRSTTKIESG